MSYSTYHDTGFIAWDDGMKNLIKTAARSLYEMKLEESTQPKSELDLPIFKNDIKSGAEVHANAQPEGFKHDYLKSGVASLVNQKIESPEHLGQLCQVYRHPKFEVFHAIYTKGNEVVGHTAITNRRIGSVNFSPSMDETISTLKSHMENNGADSYWLVHNHPKGGAFPSQADIDTTKEISTRLSGMHGHVIVNHTKFVHLTPSGEYTTHEADQSESYDLLKHSIPHDVIGRDIKGINDVQNITKQFHKSGNVVLIGLSSKNNVMHVNSLATFPRHLLSARGEGDINRGIVRVNHFIKQSGSNSKAIIGVADKSEISEYSHLVANGLVHNVVSYDGSHARENTDFDDVYDSRKMKYHSVFESKKRLQENDYLDTEDGKYLLERIEQTLK